MKKIIYITILSLSFHFLLGVDLMAQDEEGVQLDLLKAPASPASSLLKFATSDIEKPTDLSAFMLSLQSATSSFTKLPGNYAIDILPFALFRGRTDFTTTGLASSRPKDVLRQTFVLSFGIKNVDSTVDDFKSTSTYGAVGFKVSIVRPRYDSAAQATLQSIHNLQGQLNKSIYKSAKVKNEEYRRRYTRYLQLLDSIRIAHKGDAAAGEAALQAIRENAASELKQIETRLAELNLAAITMALSNEKDLLDQLNEKAKAFDNKRVGFSWDIAGGISSEFRSKRFDNSKVHNAGIWTTIGFNGKKNFSLLFLGRYLFNPEQEFTGKDQLLQQGDISTVDGGARLLYATKASKFNASLECLYRQAFTSFENDKSWRMMFNADYAIWANQKLTFSFGRNFDGTISRDGNLVAALTFLQGLGNKR